MTHDHDHNHANIPTPHIKAGCGEIAETVLMPGDPLRAKFIAETYLDDAKQYNDLRGMLGFTGTYKGKRLSVQGSGMGIPSIGIYAHELYHFYGVNNIIRVGTAGAINPDLRVRDIVIALGACTNSNFMSQFGLSGTFAPMASYALLEKAVEIARRGGLSYRVGNILSSDTFYSDDGRGVEQWRRMGVLAVEMEAAGLYATAARAGKNALCVLTVSDHLITGEATSADERQKTFTSMMKLALDTAAGLD